MDRMKRSILAFVHAEIAKNKKFRYILRIFLVKTPHPWKIAKPGIPHPFPPSPKPSAFFEKFPHESFAEGAAADRRPRFFAGAWGSLF